jgi:hypothetical protein
MNKTKIILVSIFLISSNTYSQTNQNCKCNEDLISKTNNKLKSLNYQEIFDFLYTFDDTCSSVEFEEYSNEVLFNVLQFYPSSFIELLSTKNKLYKKAIYKELSSPIVDAPYAQIIKPVDNQ